MCTDIYKHLKANKQNSTAKILVTKLFSIILFSSVKSATQPPYNIFFLAVHVAKQLISVILSFFRPLPGGRGILFKDFIFFLFIILKNTFKWMGPTLGIVFWDLQNHLFLKDLGHHLGGGLRKFLPWLSFIQVKQTINN